MLRLADILTEDAMKKLEEYIKIIGDVSGSFEEGLKLLSSFRIGDAKSAFSSLVRLENRGGRLREELEKEIAKARLETGMKEALLNIINGVDSIGDNVKEVARELTIVPFLELPEPLRNGLLRLSEIVDDAIGTFVRAFLLVLEGKYEESLQEIEKVVKLEEEADAQEVENRSLILEHGDEIKPATLAILVHYLNLSLENTADSCARAATMLKVFLLTWFLSK